METFLVLNAYELRASVDEGEQLMLGLASGAVSREELLMWIEQRIQPLAAEW